MIYTSLVGTGANIKELPQIFWGSKEENGKKKFFGPTKIKKSDFLKKPEFCALSKHGRWFLLLTPDRDTF